MFATSCVALLTLSSLVHARATPERRQQKLPYSCDPATCKLPTCYCPSEKPPGGLAVDNTPQFVLLTFDDAVNVITLPLQNAVINANKNPNGCNIPATFFVSTDYTDYHYVQTLKAAGHDIAAHTMSHPANANKSEIEGCRKAINAYSGIPLEEIKGFRAPFLEFDMNTFQAVSDLKMKWESSLSADPRTAPWPFTYDNGFPYMCQTGTCDYSRKFPGLWEIPMYSLLDPSTNNEYAVMDPAGDPTFLINLLQYNFKLHWEGNRTPMGLWLHAAWFLQDPNPNVDRVALLNNFFAWARTYTNNKVWFVTASQLLEWMENQVGIDKLTADPIFSCAKRTDVVAETCNGIDDNLDGRVDEGVTRRCDLGSYFTDTCFVCPSSKPSPVNPVPAPLPSSGTGNGSSGCLVGMPQGGCGQGKWENCACTCINELDTTANGYCKDASGTCSIMKTYNFDKKQYLCSGGSAVQTQSASPTTTSTVPSSTLSSSSSPSSSIATSSSATRANKDSLFMLPMVIIVITLLFV